MDNQEPSIAMPGMPHWTQKQDWEHGDKLHQEWLDKQRETPGYTIDLFKDIEWLTEEETEQAIEESIKDWDIDKIDTVDLITGEIINT